MEDNQALLFAQSQVEEGQARLKEVRSRQRELEMGVETLRQKVRDLEKRLYGGAVHNPRELSSMEEENRHFKSRLEKDEDELLEVMVTAEEAQVFLSEAQENLSRLEVEWRQEHKQLLQEKKHLNGEISGLENQRRSSASQIDSSTLSLYERLRNSKHGQAVAKVERGMCQGCRIALPTRIMQQARAGQELVQCNSCRRILYVS